MSNENLPTVEKPKVPENQSYDIRNPRVSNPTLSSEATDPGKPSASKIKAPKAPVAGETETSGKAEGATSGSTIKAYQEFLRKASAVGKKDTAYTKPYSTKAELASAKEESFKINSSLVETEKLKTFSSPLVSTTESEDYITDIAFLDADRGVLQNGTINASPIVFEEINYASQVFSENKNLKEAENFGEWLDGWYGSTNEKALLHLVENSKFVGAPLGSLELSRANVASANTMLSTIDSTFGSDLSSGTLQLLNSFSVSYEKPLKSLKRINTKNDQESLGQFFSKIFSVDTLKEIGSVFVDAAAEFGLKFVSSFIPTLTFGGVDDWESRADNLSPVLMDWIDAWTSTNSSKTVSKQKYYESFEKRYKSLFAPKIGGGKSNSGSVRYSSQKAWYSDEFYTYDENEIKNIQKDFNQFDQAVATTEMGLLSLLGIKYSREKGSKYSADADVSKLFKDFVTKNPVMSQHQYILRVNKHKATCDNSITEDLYNELLFRIKGVDFPAYQRSTANTNYGHSGMTLLTSLQASAKHEAVLTVVCDRNLDILEYLVRLTGMGVCTSGEFKESKPGEGLEKVARIYNLSTVSDSSYSDTPSSATLRILSGRDLLKANNMEERDLDFGQTEPTGLTLGVADEDDPKNKREKVTYGKLPVFLFENFKFVNLDYPLNFDSTKVDSKLLEVKVTATWTKIKIKWQKDTDIFRSTAEKVASNKTEEENTETE